ncbi:MAG: DUF2268 domain-containing putative Zn-dependent protease, partial [Bacteroidota bacterium]
DGTPKGKVLKKQYLAEGSQGVKDFIKYRIESGNKLAKTITSERAYYEAVRPYTFRIMELEPEIRKHYYRFKELYPATVYPAAYFVIGRKNSGGTTGPESVIMGAEMFGSKTTNPPAVLALEDLPAIVIHELVHYQQRYDRENAQLPAFVIGEGSADFLASVVIGKDLSKHHLDYYAKPKTKEIWALFQAQRERTNSNGWLYGGNANKLFPDAPNDIGYWLGFQICSAYYAKAEDKKQAIHDILNIKDFDAFIAESGYAEKMKALTE